MLKIGNWISLGRRNLVTFDASCFRPYSGSRINTKNVYGRTYVLIVYYIGFILEVYIYGEAAGFILSLIAIAVTFFIIS